MPAFLSFGGACRDNPGKFLREVPTSPQIPVTAYSIVALESRQNIQLPIEQVAGVVARLHSEEQSAPADLLLTNTGEFISRLQTTHVTSGNIAVSC